MKISNIFFKLIVLIFISMIVFGDNTLPRMFGNKESKNKCLIYYPFYFEPKDTSESEKISFFDTRNYEELLESIGFQKSLFKKTRE